MQKRKIRTKVNSIKSISLKVSRNPKVGYLSLPRHPHKPGCVAKTISLFELMGEYNGPSVYLDFSERGELIGIEIVS